MQPDILSCNCVWFYSDEILLKELLVVFYFIFIFYCLLYTSICSSLLIEVAHRIISIEWEELLVQDDQVLQSL